MKCKLIQDFPNYRIREDGIIESCYKFKTSIPTDAWREVKPIYDKGCGYLIVTLCHEGIRKNKRVHRLLGEAFIPNPQNKAHINHIDGNKLNNCITNLEWNTPTENTNHAIKLGLYDPSKSRNTAVIQICKDTGKQLAEFSSIHEAERVTGTASQNIWKVCNGKRKSAGNFAWAYK